MTHGLQTQSYAVAKDRVVQRLQEAEHALSLALGIDQVKLVMDAAAAQQVFAQRQKLGDEVVGYAHTIKTRALARLGELLAQIPKATGRAGPGRGKAGEPAGPAFNDAPTLADMGITKKVASVAQQLAALPTDVREAVAQRETTIAKARRDAKAASMPEAPPLPDTKYRVVYADPPWAYNDKADAGAVQSQGAAHHYPTMTVPELCALDIAGLCAPDAVLFLWVTAPLLFEAAPLVMAWGFTYKASFVWDKIKHNMGHYNSVRHEFLLVCTRGRCTPDVTTLYDSVQSIERTTHSTKPEEFRTIIDTLYPKGRRVELFARVSREGWDQWGNEAPRG